MAGEGTGATSSVRIKKQTALDTIPTASLRSLPFAKLTPRFQVGNTSKSRLLGSQAAVAAIYNSPGKHTLDFETELGFTTLDDLLSGIVGDPTVSGNGTTLAWANLYTPSATPSYKYIQVVEGDIPTTKAQGYKNCLVTEVTINWSGDNPLGTVTAKFVGQLNTAVAATGEAVVTTTLVTVAQQPILNTHWTILHTGVESDTGRCMRSGTIKLSRPVQEDRSCVGSAAYKAPIYTGPLETSYDFEVEFDTSAAFAAAVNQTVLTGIRMKAVGPAFTAPAGITGEFWTLEIRSSKALVPQWELPIEDNGKLVQKYSADGYGNTGSGLAYEAFAAQITNNVDGGTL